MMAGDPPTTQEVAAVIGPQRVPFAWQVDAAMPADAHDDPKELLMALTITTWTGAVVLYMDPDQADALVQGMARSTAEIRRRRRKGLVPATTAEVLQLTRKGE